jgi:hypothetical protein
MTTTTHSHKAWTDKGGHVMGIDVLHLADPEGDLTGASRQVHLNRMQVS